MANREVLEHRRLIKQGKLASLAMYPPSYEMIFVQGKFVKTRLHQRILKHVSYML